MLRTSVPCRKFVTYFVGPQQRWLRWVSSKYSKYVVVGPPRQRRRWLHEIGNELPTRNTSGEPPICSAGEAWRSRRDRRGRRRLIAGATALLWLAGPALAVDGVIEINQTKALAGGITPGDTAGFPVSINVPGSYRLTSNLDAGPGVGGIQIFASDVTLDLNGFTLLGGGEVGAADGILLPVLQSNVEIRNGTVRGFLGDGIHANTIATPVRVVGVRSIGNFQKGIVLPGPGNLVDRCTVVSNGEVGVMAWGGSLVINSVVRNNGGVGLDLTSNGGYRSNVLSDNNGGGAQVLGGIEIGPNYCQGNLICP